ncbi:MAG: hypothetical protein ACP5N1_02095 [Candidatus Woesearchaeota archaeon]
MNDINKNYDVSKLLAQYNQITDEIYLKKNGKAVAIVENNNSNTKIGFLSIRSESKNEFIGTGLVLENNALELIIHTMANEKYKSEGIFAFINGVMPSIATYLKEDNNDNLTITEDNIKEFNSQRNNYDKNNMPKYLDSFSEIPCEKYLTNTPINKLKNKINNIIAQYNPLKSKEIRSNTKEYALDYRITNIIDIYSNNIMINHRKIFQTHTKTNSKNKSSL